MTRRPPSMNLKECFLDWLERQKLALFAVPEDPRVRETKLIGRAIGVGLWIGCVLFCLRLAQFFWAAIFALAALECGYWVTKLRSFGSMPWED